MELDYKKRENTVPIYIPFELSVIQALKCIFKHMAYHRTRHLFLAMALLGFWERRGEGLVELCCVTKYLLMGSAPTSINNCFCFKWRKEYQHWTNVSHLAWILQQNQSKPVISHLLQVLFQVKIQVIAWDLSVAKFSIMTTVIPWYIRDGDTQDTKAACDTPPQNPHSLL